MSEPELIIRLPAWMAEHAGKAGGEYAEVAERMRLVIEWSRLNVKYGTGGPFAAGVFDQAGRLIAAGVNMVTSSNCSVLHAETVAIALAQQSTGCYDLSDRGKFNYELVASTEPCAMCFGAVLWSGVKSLVCGARTEDAQQIGFDEGAKLPDWIEELNKRGISVQQDVLRFEAVAVLQEYIDTGGEIYNAGKTR